MERGPEPAVSLSAYSVPPRTRETAGSDGLGHAEGAMSADPHAARARSAQHCGGGLCGQARGVRPVDEQHVGADPAV